MVSPIQIEFETKLTQFGLSYSYQNEGIYAISSQHDRTNLITVRLLRSLTINKHISGSRNGNELQGIGRFKFKLPASVLEPDFLSFGFQNTVKDQVEFLIIPFQEFWRRHFKINLGINPNRLVEMAFWLMDDGFAYDVTDISLEGEWFFLSNGMNGKMAEGSELDYSDYLNSWKRITVK